MAVRDVRMSPWELAEVVGRPHECIDNCGVYSYLKGFEPATVVRDTPSYNVASKSCSSKDDIKFQRYFS